MKRLLCGGLVALGLAVTAAPAKADCYFHSTCCRSVTFVRTCRNRCWSFNSYCNPLPCVGTCGYGGPAPWNVLAAYGPYGYPPRPAPVAAAVPAAPAPAATPSFKAPPPAPATKSQTGVQQAGYFYYGQTPNSGSASNYEAGYGYGYYGYGANYSYAQAPNYWY